MPVSEVYKLVYRLKQLPKGCSSTTMYEYEMKFWIQISVPSLYFMSHYTASSPSFLCTLTLGLHEQAEFRSGSANVLTKWIYNWHRYPKVGFRTGLDIPRKP